MLQLAELRARSATLIDQYASLWGRLDLAGNRNRLDEIERQLSSPDAWNNPERLTPVLQEKSQLEGEITRLERLETCRRDVTEWLTLAEEEEAAGEPGQEALESLAEQVMVLQNLLQETEMNMLLSGKEDRLPAIVEIHPGAGGTEAQDWAEMLVRMYLRWADTHDMKAEYLDYLAGDEAGVKSVTLRMAGPNAYGLLKGEKGIHRLIRISPFDSSGRRHTSFASVDVIPDVGQEITVDIKETDLRIDIFRSSGPGGQSVNTTSSAVRITHLPTGISAQCQNEKSQHSNRDTAMQILRARLYELELRKLEEEKKAQYAGKDAIGFGSQIRTYTLQPYRLVKDHRTNTEIGDVEAVLDGRIDQLLRDYLLYLHGQKTN
ncbi:peptide chain release factor 2 [Nitratidesulfovibrio sp. 1201_IL3209]|uniref:peptide chain release factor 2 n=1 Tax=Nitratidesulfovibrio sp. 1201_IL3209 TaxID=3084053 RepID=UPI002FDB5F76